MIKVSTNFPDYVKEYFDTCLEEQVPTVDTLRFVLEQQCDKLYSWFSEDDNIFAFLQVYEEVLKQTGG